jgi:hypothetical protein
MVRHPWEKWFSKKSFRLIRGKHFNGMVHSMAQQVRNAASARGLRVSIAFTFTKDSDAQDTLVVSVGETK